MAQIDVMIAFAVAITQASKVPVARVLPTSHAGRIYECGNIYCFMLIRAI